ncbi:MAG: cysteine-rich CWC family protein [Bacteroidales bacterium]|nr:cysteine-rich CWC family protein [Bacteroidales bacterium]
MKGKLKRCPSCGRFFTCDGNNDCWCEKVNLHKREFLVLNQKYTDCICPHCLDKYAEK